jgi:hypothetical protein
VDSGPLQNTRPLNTVFWEPGCVGDSTDGKCRWFVQHVKRALVAGSNGGEDDSGLTLETLPIGAVELSLINESIFEILTLTYLRFHRQSGVSSSLDSQRQPN